MPITKDELARYHRDGFITIQTPFSDLAPLIAALDAGPSLEGWRVDYHPRANIGTDPELVRFVTHPFFEALAQRVLRAESVALASLAYRRSVPTPGIPRGLEEEHTDFRCSRADLRASPARYLCACLVWLGDVTVDTFPIHVRPGSHLAVARYHEAHPEEDSAESGQPVPDIPLAPTQPVLARAGDLTLLSGPLVHSGSLGGSRERRVLFVEYRATRTRFPYYVNDDPIRRDRYFHQLSHHVPAERAHVVPRPPLAQP